LETVLDQASSLQSAWAAMTYGLDLHGSRFVSTSTSYSTSLLAFEIAFHTNTYLALHVNSVVGLSLLTSVSARNHCSRLRNVGLIVRKLVSLLGRGEDGKDIAFARDIAKIKLHMHLRSDYYRLLSSPSSPTSDFSPLPPYRLTASQDQAI
jgi:hypothetical protein